MTITVYLVELCCVFFVSFSSLYEEYLGAPFPFGCYKQVFLPGDAVISTNSIGASVATFSADLLADEHIIDEVGYDIVTYNSHTVRTFAIS